MTEHRILDRPISIRAHAPAYTSASLLLVFLSLCLFYFAFASLALLAAGIALLAVPLLAATDRIVFNGRRLYRRGVCPYLWARINRFRPTIKLQHIEHIETTVRGSFKRGSTVNYLFRTMIIGGDQTFTFSGWGRGYRRFARTLFAMVPERIMDNRSLSILQYLAYRSETLKLARHLKLPSAEALEGIARDLRRPRRTRSAETSVESVEELRIAANQLRLNGDLVRATEAFRRALNSSPGDGWLLFEAALCTNALAQAERNDRLGRRSVALLRLAERAAHDDGVLLERIAEAYLHFGAVRRAKPAFQLAVERFGERFRSLLGLAEIALEQGKLAHVAHNFAAVGRTETRYALRRWANAEADYFSRLNDDEEYMSIEAGRLDLLDRLVRWKKLAFRLAVYSMPLIAIGAVVADPLIASTGWLVSGFGLLLWLALGLSTRLFISRIPYDMVHNNK